MTTTHTPQELSQYVSDNDKKAFVAYYNERSIIPVSQDTDDPDFIFRRNSLYKLLGIPLSTLRGRNILELGPGGGYNALAVTHFKPRSYVFVDATKASLHELNRKNSLGMFGETDVEIVESNIFDFTDSRTFDAVIIEGVIPGQTKPKQMLRHAASFVSEGGFLITTTSTATSLLSEVCRRLFRPLIINRHEKFDEQIEEAVKIFEPHLKTLGTKTRPPKDWVLDCILHKWEKNAIYIFSILDCIEAIGERFDFYGSSPKFLIDDRFYKKIDRSAAKSNDLAAQQFSALSSAMLDYRVPLLSAMSFNEAANLDDLCTTLFNIQVEIVDSNNYDRLGDFFFHLKQVRDLLPKPFTQTVLAIDDFIENFPKLLDRNANPQFEEFAKWWGRGQQYASFIRVA